MAQAAKQNRTQTTEKNTNLANFDERFDGGEELIARGLDLQRRQRLAHIAYLRTNIISQYVTRTNSSTTRAVMSKTNANQTIGHTTHEHVDNNCAQHITFEREHGQVNEQ